MRSNKTFGFLVLVALTFISGTALAGAGKAMSIEEITSRLLKLEHKLDLANTRNAELTERVAELEEQLMLFDELTQKVYEWANDNDPKIDFVINYVDQISSRLHVAYDGPMGEQGYLAIEGDLSVIGNTSLNGHVILNGLVDWIGQGLDGSWYMVRLSDFWDCLAHDQAFTLECDVVTIQL